MNSCFDAMRRYFVFSGRSTRSQFWLYTLFVVILFIVGLIIDGAIGSDLGYGPGVLGASIYVAHIIPSLAITVRRLHDSDKAGFWCLVGLIPLIGSLVLLVFMCTASTPGPNRFGPRPSDGAAGSNDGHHPGVTKAASATITVSLDQLEKLASLRASGAIDDEEFQRMKADMLNRGAG